jgi:anti-sigma factor ChrR (cupin superfamily)
MGQVVTQLHADFSRRVVLHAEELPWQDSPMAGVQRRMFDRIGGEVARATSLVRYTPGSRFSPHVHGGGEVFVLDGSFTESGSSLRRHSWLRLPDQAQAQMLAGSNGARVWIKTGHLHWAVPPAA